MNDISRHGIRPLLIALLAACLIPAAAAHATPFETNLIVNGDAEANAPSATGFEVVPLITGWTRTGNLTLVPWSGVGNFPDNANAGPVVRGNAFFTGGPSGASSNMFQTIDVSDLSSAIDAGSVGFRLAGYLGGYATQGDNAAVRVKFQGAAAESLGTAALGPVTTAQRSSATGLLFREQAGAVPAGTRSVEVRLVCTRLVGSYNDGYADSLSLSLASSTVGVEDARVPGVEFAAVAPNPARNGVRFAFRLPQSAAVRLDVMDAQGRRVATVAHGELAAGVHAMAWRKSGAIPAGVYFARLQVGQGVMRRRFVLLD